MPLAIAVQIAEIRRLLLLDRGWHVNVRVLPQVLPQGRGPAPRRAADKEIWRPRLLRVPTAVRPFDPERLANGLSQPAHVAVATRKSSARCILAPVSSLVIFPCLKTCLAPCGRAFKVSLLRAFCACL